VPVFLAASCKKDKPRPRPTAKPQAVVAPAPADRPDLVLVTIESLRRDHLELYGYERKTAPRLAALAREAVVFDEAIAASANTAPSHASIMTGRYPLSHGLVPGGSRLDPGVGTLAGTLGKWGYRAAAFVGGSVLAGNKTRLDRGFELYDDDLDPKTGERASDRTVDAAAKWLEGLDRKKPFFLFVHLVDPRQPYRPPHELLARYLEPGEWDRKEDLPAYQERLQDIRKRKPTEKEKREFIARYDAEITHADAQLGRLFDLLKKRKRFAGSLVVVLSDHGETLAERSHPFCHGARPYDEQIRIPLVIRFPKGKWGGRRSDIDAHHIDILPTVLDYLDIVGPGDIEGVSLMDAVRDPRRQPRRPMYSHALAMPERMGASGKGVTVGGLVSLLRQPPFKIIVYPSPGDPVVHLFNVDREPAEMISGTGGLPDVTENGLKAVRDWEASLARKRPPPAAPNPAAAVESKPSSAGEKP
jgi:arylsulfatase A-like enzyme